MSIPLEQKTIARYLSGVIKGKPSVSKYWDDAKKSNVDIMSIADRPNAGISTVTTLGLLNSDIGLEADGKPLRVEVLMIFNTSQGSAQNILATCAFNVINSNMEIYPGAVFPRVVELYRPDSDMKHILFVSPYLWSLETKDFESKKVTWLHGIPISDEEFEFSLSEGTEALEDLLEKEKVDIVNLDRKSIL